MIVAIFVLAVILLLAGLAGLVSAINLVPTDLGFTYFQAGSTAISAGCVILALGFAVKVLNRSLQRLATPEPVRVPALDAMLDLPPLPPIKVEPAPFSGTPEAGNPSEASLIPAMAIAGGAAALTAGAIAATSWIPPVAQSAAAGTDSKLVDELERDLFSEAEALPEPPPVSMPEIAAQASLDDLLTDKPETDKAEAVKPSYDFDFPLPDFALRPALDIRDEGDNQSEAQIASAEADAPEPAAATPEDVTPDHVAQDKATFEVDAPDHEYAAPDPVAPDHASWASQPADPVLPAVEVEAPAAVPAPGLIHDADFAAVADQALPPLAPVSSLDVIGAYDSGGTRFTMYSDGSVVAAGPEGERRFRSLDELRRHIDSGLA